MCVLRHCFSNSFLLLEGEYKSETLDTLSDHPSFNSLKSVRRKNLHGMILTHLNINSLRNEFDYLVDHINGNVEILAILETKLDESFLERQFKISCFTTHF